MRCVIINNTFDSIHQTIEEAEEEANRLNYLHQYDYEIQVVLILELLKSASLSRL